jgi:hypothetical protein
VKSGSRLMMAKPGVDSNFRSDFRDLQRLARIIHMRDERFDGPALIVAPPSNCFAEPSTFRPQSACVCGS